MRTLSFILAFAFVLAGPSIAGVVGQRIARRRHLPLQRLPVATTAPQPIVVAAN